MRSTDIEIQGAGDDSARDGEYQTHTRRDPLPLCRSAEPYVGQGFQSKEAERRRDVAMHLSRLLAKRSSYLLLLYFVEHLPLPQQLHHAMRWLWAQQDE